MIGIIIAMEKEVIDDFLTHTNFKKNYSHKIKSRKYYIFETNSGENIVIGFSGIGKTNAAICATQMIANFNIDLIVNIGSAGAFLDNLNLFDVVLVNKNYYFDVDLTAFGYEYGVLPKQPLFFNTDPFSNKIIEEVLKSFNNFNTRNGTCSTGDSFLSNQNLSKYNFFLKNNPDVIDMESCSIAQTCNEFKVKFSCIKIVSDYLFSKKKSSIEFDDNLKKIAIMISDIIYNISEKLVFENLK